MYFSAGGLFVVQSIYAKYFGIPLTTIALVLLLSRLFDAITDPIVGFLSDRYYVKKNTRKPFVIVGGVLFAISSYFLFVPTQIENPDISVIVSGNYFIFWFFAFYLAYTIFEIPHAATGGELSWDSKQKNRAYGSRALAVNLGFILFYIIPLLPFFETSEITPITLKWAAIFSGMCMFASLYYYSKYEVINTHKKSIYKDNSQNISKYSLLYSRDVLKNRPLLMYLSSFIMFGIGYGMWFSLMFIFIDAYLGLGGEFAKVNLIGLVSGLTVSGVWIRLANQYGKKLVWFVGLILCILSIIIASQLVPGQKSSNGLVLVMILFYSGTMAVNIMAPSMLADIINYSAWKFRSNSAASHFSLFTLSAKTTLAIGSALSLAIIGWHDFDTVITDHTKEQIFSLRLAAFWLPVPLLMISAMLVALNRINNRSHSIIIRRLRSLEYRGNLSSR